MKRSPTRLPLLRPIGNGGKPRLSHDDRSRSSECVRNKWQRRPNLLRQSYCRNSRSRPQRTPARLAFRGPWRCQRHGSAARQSFSRVWPWDITDYAAWFAKPRRQRNGLPTSSAERRRSSVAIRKWNCCNARPSRRPCSADCGGRVCCCRPGCAKRLIAAICRRFSFMNYHTYEAATCVGTFCCT